MAKFLSALLAGFVISGLVFGVFSRHATADLARQAEKRDSSNKGANIAVVNLSQVFKTSKSFLKMQDELKLKVKEEDEVAKRMTAELQRIAQKLKGAEKDPEERKEWELQLRKKQADFEEFRKEASRKLQKESSTVFIKMHRITAKVIAEYAQAQEIDFVVRAENEPSEEDDPQHLMMNMNRHVLYQNKLDITEEIIAAIEDQ
jgi:Skp family chaperone for outer membrane proteins